MQRLPVEPRKRRVIEMTIRVFDILIYAAVVAGGVYALFFTPNTILRELTGWEWMIPIWAGFLLVGGGLGLFARISTIWIFEQAATIASFVGIAMYLIVLGTTAFTSITAAVATALVFVAALGVARRFLELQLFGSDPTHTSFITKLEDAWHRRTPNVVPRG